MGISVKALSFEIEGRRTYGVLEGNTVREAAADLRERCATLKFLLADEALERLPERLESKTYSVESIRFLPLIPDPDKIICVGVNYRPHVEEMGRQVPDKPLLFVRFPGSVVGHRQALIKSQVSDEYDFEGELAVVIGRPARHVAMQDAFDYVAGYTCFMDGTVRDWQRHTSQFTPGKNFQASGALGPALVTRDEVPDPGALSLITSVNGERMQEGRVSELIFDIPALIEYCSTFTELLPGDIIATGTPGGVGAARTPPVWLQAGDSVEVAIQSIGQLENTVREE
jgi:2-keto-4-pentenoate hydratase/2-oxohepta-3-ene-1,7-dioic acid hydratase in catechol pathway